MTPTTARSAYALLVEPECPAAERPADAEIRAEIDRPAATKASEHLGLPELRKAAGAWSAGEREHYRALADRAPDDAARRLLARGAALDCAPLALVSGAWLQWLSSMATADAPAALAALSLYASDVGVGRPHGSRGAAHEDLLQGLGAAEFARPPARLALDGRIPDEAFHLPAVLLLMSRRPAAFDAEILGADLCLRAAGTPPPLVLAEDVRTAAGPDDLDPGRPRGGAVPGGLSGAEAALVALADAGGPDVERRAAAGFRWALAGLRDWSAGLRERLAAGLDPAHRAAELIRARAREGSVYHHDFELAGRPLARWLDEARTDPWPLLGVLAASRLVRPGRPERSPLVNGLVGEHGAMFRVFTPEDLAVLRAWIGSLPADRGDGATVRTAGHGTAAARSFPFDLSSHAAAPRHAERPPADLREAYVRLQRRGQQPALQRYAREYVHGWLGRARHRMERAGTPLPDAWPAEGLRPWLAHRHDGHAEEFERTAGTELPPREQLIESTVQLAPLTMIDGGWLQGFTDYGLASSDIGYSLFETYWDELGNGRADLNHPLIYRELVESMGVRLPPTGTTEFARWEGFEDASFELPVFWLSIGRFPRTFQPEILGLNLAMELSGVGGSYRRARLGLRAHGFSTRFVDIHNTIDNVATGHSAWAADAIDSFMSSTALDGGEPARAAAWQRVRVGYRALNPPTGVRAGLADRRARRSSRNR